MLGDGVVQLARQPLPLLQHRDLLRARVEPRVLDGHRELVGDDADDGGILVGERLVALHVHHPEHAVPEQDRRGQLGARRRPARRRQVAWVRSDVVHQDGAPGARGLAHEPARDGDAILARDALLVVAALHAEHQHARLLGVDQGDGEVGEAEQLVDGIGGALEQLVEAEVGGDQPRDARDQRHPVGALALVLVAPRVRDGDRGRPREQGERLDLLGAEPALGTTDTEEADHATAPLDGHPDDAMVREVRLGRVGQVAIPLEHHRAATLEHRAGQPHTARHLGAVLARRHAVAGGGPDEVAGGIHQPDRAVLGADELAGMTQDALQQRLQLELAADGLGHRAHALLLPQQLPKLRRCSAPDAGGA